MLDKNNFKDIVTFGLVLALFIFAAIILKPVAMAIFSGILLAYVCFPLYKLILRKVKNENISAFLILLGLIIVTFGVLVWVVSSLSSQAINLYLGLQSIDITNIVREVIPEILSPETSALFASSISTFISNFLATSLEKFSDFILNLPMFLLQLFVVMFIFFFSLRDGERAVEYIKTLSPLKKETQDKFFKQFRGITYSVLVGQIIIGIFQGLVAGIGYWIFGVDNAIILTILTMLVGVIPLIGPWLIWVPVDIYVFGILGLIIGPLVLAYVLLVMELYRKKTLSEKESIVFKEIE